MDDVFTDLWCLGDVLCYRVTSLFKRLCRKIVFQYNRGNKGMAKGLSLSFCVSVCVSSQPVCTARFRPTRANHGVKCLLCSSSSRTLAPCMTLAWTRSWRWTLTRRQWRPCSARTWPVTQTFWECGSQRYWTGQHGCVCFYAMLWPSATATCH